jgi:hypothetical protein
MVDYVAHFAKTYFCRKPQNVINLQKSQPRKFAELLASIIIYTLDRMTIIFTFKLCK